MHFGYYQNYIFIFVLVKIIFTNLFKSIQYKLYVYTLILIITVAGFSYLVFSKEYIYAVPVVILLFIVLCALKLHYQKYNDNIIFLLNALENGDYSFSFTAKKLSVREREFNMILNRIKEILTSAKREVIENEKFLSLIVESVSTGIIIMDEHGHVVTVNGSALDILGLTVFTHVNQLSGINPDFPDLLRNMYPCDSLQISIPNERENKQVSLNMSKLTIRDKIIKVVTLSNIGNELEAKEIESWIKLIRVMTHEIMNSIAPIASLSETMLNRLKPVDEKTEELSNTITAFETINTTAKGLLTFVESYRKFTKIPSPVKENFNLFVLINNILSLELDLITSKNIEIDLISNNDSVEIFADQSLITQILVNVIKNAIEATENSELRKIIITIKCINGVNTIIDVANNGSPIPEDVLPHIFVPFFTTKSNGTGVGLSISRYIARLHGGKLSHFVSNDGLTVFRIVI